MIDKKLLCLLGKNRKYIYGAVGMMAVGLLANIAVNAAICRAIDIAVCFEKYEGTDFIMPGSNGSCGHFRAVCGRESFR